MIDKQSIVLRIYIIKITAPICLAYMVYYVYNYTNTLKLIYAQSLIEYYSHTYMICMCSYMVYGECSVLLHTPSTDKEAT